MAKLSSTTLTPTEVWILNLLLNPNITLLPPVTGTVKGIVKGPSMITVLLELNDQHPMSHLYLTHRFAWLAHVQRQKT